MLPDGVAVVWRVAELLRRDVAGERVEKADWSAAAYAACAAAEYAAAHAARAAADGAPTLPACAEWAITRWRELQGLDERPVDTDAVDAALAQIAH